MTHREPEEIYLVMPGSMMVSRRGLMRARCMWRKGIRGNCAGNVGHGIEEDACEYVRE